MDQDVQNQLGKNLALEGGKHWMSEKNEFAIICKIFTTEWNTLIYSKLDQDVQNQLGKSLALEGGRHWKSEKNEFHSFAKFFQLNETH